MPRGSKKLGSPPSGVSASKEKSGEIENKSLEDIFGGPPSKPKEEAEDGLLDF